MNSLCQFSWKLSVQSDALSHCSQLEKRQNVKKKKCSQTHLHLAALHFFFSSLCSSSSLLSPPPCPADYVYSFLTDSNHSLLSLSFTRASLTYPPSRSSSLLTHYLFTSLLRPHSSSSSSFLSSFSLQIPSVSLPPRVPSFQPLSFLIVPFHSLHSSSSPPSSPFFFNYLRHSPFV